MVQLFLATAVLASGQTFTTLFNFDHVHGAAPLNMSLVQGMDGNLFGTTAGGGSHNCDQGCGTIFEITPAGLITTLHYFTGADGSAPNAGLLLAPDGSFYGTTEQGGVNGYGTVFKFTIGGGLTTLHNFNSTDGAMPTAALVFGPDGNLYGTTFQGGASSACGGGCGTVFQITPEGTLTSLYSMNFDEGYYPTGALVLGPDGLFYGTTEWGGANAYGIVFSITTSGAFTSLYSFAWAEDHNPTAPMIATDGYFYGTNAGGDFPTGTRGNVFKISPAGELTAVYEFTGGNDGGAPNGGLIRATDGNFYGTSALFPEGVGSCGRDGCGNIFKVTPDGTLTSLHTFTSIDGGQPRGGLVQGTDGDFYGTTSHGGTQGLGTVFKISTGLGPFVKILPAAGAVGSRVAILGTNLAGATRVTFNGEAAPFTVVSLSRITAIVPAGATTGVVRVITPNEILSSDSRFRVQP